jgi:hypothetical protein
MPREGHILRMTEPGKKDDPSRLQTAPCSGDDKVKLCFALVP